MLIHLIKRLLKIFPLAILLSSCSFICLITTFFCSHLNVFLFPSFVLLTFNMASTFMIEHPLVFSHIMSNKPVCNELIDEEMANRSIRSCLDILWSYGKKINVGLVGKKVNFDFSSLLRVLTKFWTTQKT